MENHARVMPETTPVVLAESSTTLREDQFIVRDVSAGYPDVACLECNQLVCPIEDGDDLNTLVRLAYAHAQECEERK